MKCIKEEERENLDGINHDNFLNSVGPFTEFEKYASIFSSELGCLPGDVKLSVDEKAFPVALPVRGVPFALRDALKAELDRLVDLQVITAVDEPTDWVSQLVVTIKKSGALRLCIDPKPLNAALRREYYCIPTLDDVLPSLNGARFFTRVDLSSAFWQLKLDEQSSYLTTFGTPFGRFRWLRLPFGLKVSSEIFQKRLIQALDKLPGTVCIADDVLVFGKTQTEHDQNLELFFQRCMEQGIRLTRDKVEHKVPSVTFHGHVLTADGLKADPEKVKAIQLMPAPEDVRGVARLNGMVNYLSRFLPHLADMMEPIRKLTHKGVPWNWEAAQQTSLEKIKQAMTEAPVLAYYDPQLPLVVQCDSSQSGLGAVLMQQGKPLDYRSRSLTPAERNYAQIEKELLAIVFALERFNTYTFGRKVVVLSDHKPLVNIVTKPLTEVPKRLQRMLIRLQKYDYELSYQPGAEMFIADTLSRAYILDGNEKESEFEIVSMIDISSMPASKILEIKDAIKQDPVMQQLAQILRTGWPSNAKDVPEELAVYYKDRDQFTTEKELILKGDRLVIPRKLRLMLIKELHVSHSGISSSIRRARELFYWPGMTADIKDFVARCEICRSHDRQQAKEPMLLRELPTRPWQIIAADLFTHAQKQYLVIADYYSDYFEIDHLTTVTSASVINRMRAQFARHGIPELLFSDNGPQFISEEFRRFKESWGFEHRTSSPYYSKSNGKAESAVKAAKRILTLARESGNDPYLMLLEHRNIPTALIEHSPAQRIFNRRTRTRLPTIANALIPTISDPKEIAKRLQERREKQKQYHDLGARELRELQNGEEVWVLSGPDKPGIWTHGRVTRKLDYRSYEVEVDGALKRRNRIDLRAYQGPNLIMGAGKTRSGVTYQKGEDVEVATISVNGQLPLDHLKTNHKQSYAIRRTSNQISEKPTTKETKVSRSSASEQSSDVLMRTQLKQKAADSNKYHISRSRARSQPANEKRDKSTANQRT